MKLLFFAVVLALAASAASAQQRPQQPSQSSRPSQSVQSFGDLRERAAQSNFEAHRRADQQGWLDSMKTQDKLRVRLAQAWQSMGMSPEGARRVADAYDPELAARSHHTSLRGKSDEQIAQLMRDALRDGRYLKADMLLIDYQRQQLALDELSAP
jgi:hypothetical protein